MPGPLQVVEPPAPSPAPFGLLETVGPAVDDQGDRHWQAGIVYQALCPSGGSTYSECLAVTGVGAPPPPPELADNVDLNLRAATPFTVFAQFDCPPVGQPERDELAGRALARVEGWQVERAFWSGVAGGQPVVFPHLAEDTALLGPPGPPQYTLQTAATVPTTHGPADLPATKVMGALEGALGSCYRGQQGVLHVPAAALATLQAARLVERRGAQLTSPAGHLVVAGGGYPGSGPDGAQPAAGLLWVYATGRVFYYRGPVRTFPLAEGFDRARNTARMIAERTYLLAWDCCHFAALLNTTV
jgi:hypothetical protein